MTRGDLWGTQWRTNDSSVFMYGGKQILDGGTPYVDFWDHKGPMIYIVNAFGLALGGDSPWGIVALEFACLAAGGILIFTICRNISNAWIALPMAAAYIASMASNLDRGNLTEEYAVVFVVIAFFAATRKRSEISFSTGFWVGACGAIAALFKITYIITPAAIGIALVAVALLRKEPKSAVRAGAGGFAGLAIITIPTVVYFWSRGALGEAVYANWTYQISYASDQTGIPLPTLLQQPMNRLATTGLGVLALTGWVVALYRSVAPRTDLHRVVCIALAISLPIEVFAALISGRLFPHYIMMLVPVGVLAATIWLSELTAGHQRHGAQATVTNGIAIALSGLTVAIIMVPALGIWNRAEQGYVKSELSLQIAQDVQGHTNSSDTILVWDFAPWIYTISDREAPSRFFYVSSIFRGDRAEIWQEELLNDIVDSPPKMILVSDEDPFVPKSVNSLEEFDRPITEPLSPLVSFVQENYSREDAGNGWIYYILDTISIP